MTLIEPPEENLGAPTSGPMRALDLHLAYWEWADTPGRLEKYYEASMAQAYGEALGYSDDFALYAENERKMLNQGRTCWIDPKMIDIAMHNAGIEHTDIGVEFEIVDMAERQPSTNIHMDLWLDETRVPVLRPEMLPAETGLLILGKPFPLADYDVRIVETVGPEALPYLDVTAIGWMVSDDISSETGPKPGVVLYEYVDPHLLPIAKSYEAAGESVPPMSLVDFSGWSFDTAFTITDWHMPDSLDSSQIRPHVASVRMFMASVWGLMNSYIVRQRPVGPAGRRAKRSKRTPEDGDVTVIHLRKFLQTVKYKTKAEDYDANGDPNWSHRWIVRGHWAWRACKCAGHGGRHRVYIDPYIKGPEYLPLVMKEKILSLDR